MKKYEISNEILKIKEIKNIEEIIFFRKVTPKFFSHDEDEYHIESKVELILNYVDDNNEEKDKKISFYNEHQIEYIGQEVEVEIDEFIELQIETDEYKKAKEKVRIFKENLERDFQI